MKYTIDDKPNPPTTDIETEGKLDWMIHDIINGEAEYEKIANDPEKQEEAIKKIFQRRESQIKQSLIQEIREKIDKYKCEFNDKKKIYIALDEVLYILEEYEK